MADRNIENLSSPLYIGGSTNRAAFATDGTETLEGNATVYRDMVGDLFGRRLNSTAGKVDYDWDNNAIKFQSGGSIGTVTDRVQANLQIDHFFKVGTGITFSPHLHWFQDVASGAVVSFVMTLEYRLQRNGQAKTSTWTAITTTAGGSNDIFDFTGEADGTYNQLTKFPTFTVECGISDTIQFRMARTDSETGDMLVYFMDMHGEIDSFGSATEWVK